MKRRILVIEDDSEICALLKDLLSRSGFKVLAAASAETGLAMIHNEAPDLVISDIHLPGISGIRLCELLKSEPRTRPLPFILLTVSKTELDKVRGLRTGADDYVTKPFGPMELVARVEALLRRSAYGSAPGRILKLKELTIDLDRREAQIKGKVLPLRRKEYDLLALFLERPDRVLTKHFLTEALWKDEAIVTSNTLNSHIKNLREKLGGYKDIIETVIGEGYRLKRR